MAENGNRGPNDFRTRNGRRRREPPIIDASATEVPVDPVETAPEADAEPLPAPGPPTHETSGDDQAGRETAEPVLFGSALRDPVPPSEAAAAPADEAPAVTPAEPATVDPAPAAGATTDTPVANVSENPAAAATRPGFGAGGPAEPPRSFGTGGSAVPPTAAVPLARAGGAAAWLLGLSNLVLLAALAWTLYTAPQRDGHAELAELNNKVAALEARPDASQLQGNLAALGKRLDATEADRSALDKRVAGLETRLDTVAQQAQGAAQADAGKAAPAPTGAAAPATVGALSALAARVDGVDKSVSTLSADQARTAKAVSDLPKPVPPDFGPIEARVAGVVSQLSGKVAALDGRVTAVDGKLNDTVSRLNGFDAKVNGVDGKINGFDSRMNGVEARANGLEARLNETTAGLGKLQGSVAGLAALQAATASLDKRVGTVERQLSAPKDGERATEARAVGSADETRATPIALVAQAVARAVDDGRPYATDLDTLKTLGAAPDAIARLQPLAAKGAPTPAALKERWDAVSNDVLAAVKPAEAGSLLDRLGSHALSVVQVRRVGAAQGDDPGALVAQIDSALDAGDVAGALAAWGKLPQAGRDRSADWGAAAKARVEAAEAAQGLVGQAIATLGRTKS